MGCGGLSIYLDVLPLGAPLPSHKQTPQPHANTDTNIGTDTTHAQLHRDTQRPHSHMHMEKGEPSTQTHKHPKARVHRLRPTLPPRRDSESLSKLRAAIYSNLQQKETGPILTQRISYVCIIYLRLLLEMRAGVRTASTLQAPA